MPRNPPPEVVALEDSTLRDHHNYIADYVKKAIASLTPQERAIVDRYSRVEGSIIYLSDLAQHDEVIGEVKAKNLHYWIEWSTSRFVFWRRYHVSLGDALLAARWRPTPSDFSGYQPSGEMVPSPAAPPPPRE